MIAPTTPGRTSTWTSDNPEATGIWGNDSTIWVANLYKGDYTAKRDGNTEKIFAYRRTDNPNTPENEYGGHDPDRDFNTLYAAGNQLPRGICSDGTTMWVVDSGTRYKEYLTINEYGLPVREYWSSTSIFAYGMADRSRQPWLDKRGIGHVPWGAWCEIGTSGNGKLWLVDPRAKKLYSFGITAGAAEATRPNTPAMGSPTISGTARVDETLTAHTSGIADADGLDNATFTYQWIAGNADIEGATGPTYQISHADVGRTMQVRVSFTDDRNFAESLSSAPTGAVAAAANNSATGAPTISGPAGLGVTLSAGVTAIADEDGLTNAVFGYQWIRHDGNTGTDISGATASNYTLATADVGKTLTVKVSFTDDRGNEESLTSAATAAVAPRGVVWSADMLVVDYKTGAIGADSPDLFSNVAGSAGFGAKWLWYYSPGFQLHLAFTESLADAEDMTLQVGNAEFPFPEGSSGESGFNWHEVSPVDWEDGQTIAVRVVRTSEVVAPRQRRSVPAGAVPAGAVPEGAEEQRVARPATGAPVISGTARVDETLTAGTTGIADEDGLTNALFSYQWMADDENIEGAINYTYTLTEDDEGKTIKVRVSFTDDAGGRETLTSTATDVVALEAGPLTGFTVVDASSDPDGELGTLEGGSTLTLDNPAGGSYGIRVDTDSNDDIHKVVLALSGAKTASKHEWVFPYSLYGDDGEDNLTGESLPAGAYELKATAYDDDGDVLGTLKVSFAVTAGQPAQQPTVVPNNSATGVPTVSGTAQVGQTLTADVSAIADEDGLTNAVFSYQWMADDANIQSATNATYTLAEDDEGKAIKVLVSFTDDAENMESLTSAPTDAVATAPARNIEATGAPTISGTAQVGQTLTAGTTGIADEDGLTNALFSYQWMADDENIEGAINYTYTLTEDDEGKTIKVRVSFTDDASNEESLTSAATDAVAAPPVPGRPLDLDGEATAEGIELTWSAPPGDTVVEYVIYRAELENSQLNGRPMTKYATIDATGEAMAYINANVEEGVEYRYRVAAVNSAGEGKKSNWLDITAEEPST